RTSSRPTPYSPIHASASTSTVKLILTFMTPPSTLNPHGVWTQSRGRAFRPAPAAQRLLVSGKHALRAPTHLVIRMRAFTTQHTHVQAHARPIVLSVHGFALPLGSSVRAGYAETKPRANTSRQGNPVSSRARARCLHARSPRGIRVAKPPVTPPGDEPTVPPPASTVNQLNQGHHTKPASHNTTLNHCLRVLVHA